MLGNNSAEKWCLAGPFSDEIDDEFDAEQERARQNNSNYC